MKKLIVFAALLTAGIAQSQESKLNYVAAARADMTAICVAYELVTVDDLLGSKGLSLKIRSLGGIPNTGSLVTGGGDLALSVRIGKSGEFDAYGSAGVGVLFVDKRKPGPCLTLGIKVFGGTNRVASKEWLRL